MFNYSRCSVFLHTVVILAVVVSLVPWAPMLITAAMSRNLFLKVSLATVVCGALLWLGIYIAVYYQRTYNKKLEAQPVLRRYSVLPFALLICALLIGIVTQPETANPSWVALAQIVIAVGIIVLAGRNEAHRILTSLEIILAGQALFGLVNYFAGGDYFITPGFGTRAGGTFGDPNEFYTLCMIGAALAFAKVRAHGDRSASPAVLTCGILNLAACAAAANRAGLIALAVLSAVDIILHLGQQSSSSLRRIIAMAALLAITAVVWCTVARAGHSGSGIYLDRSASGRFLIWNLAGRVVVTNLPFGCGYAMYPREQFAVWSQFHPSESFPTNLDPKSLFLYLGAEFGLVGFALAAVTIWGMWQIASLYRQTRPDERCPYLAFLYPLIAVGVSGLMDTPVICFFRLPATGALLFVVACAVKLESLGSEQYLGFQEVIHAP